MADLQCPHCGVANKADSTFCESCGKALPTPSTGPRIVGDRDLANTAEGRQVQSEELRAKMKSASTALLAVAILALIGGFCLFAVFNNMSGEQLGDPTIDTKVLARIMLITQVVLSATYFGLFFWARRSPFPAAVVGLVIYLTLILVNAVLDPATLLQGWIIKLIIISVLVKAVQAGLQYRKLLAASGQS